MQQTLMYSNNGIIDRRFFGTLKSKSPSRGARGARCDYWKWKVFAQRFGLEWKYRTPQPLGKSLRALPVHRQ